MRIWLIGIGDPLPIDGEKVRPHRLGMLARLLVERGHEVLWWASTFDHARKRQRYDQDTVAQVEPGFRLALLHAMPYRRNVSAARLINHRQIGHKFAEHARRERIPDLILCSFPTVELSWEAVQFGRSRSVPVVLDVRDLWPDNFLEVLPGVLRGPARVALRPLIRQTAEAFGRATAIVAMSEGCLRHGLSYGCREGGARDAVVPLAYEPPRVSEEAVQDAGARLRARGVDPTRHTLWFIGTFGKHYDVGTLLVAARELERRCKGEVQFVISGDGDRRAEWKRQARGLTNVVFTGWVDLPEIAYLMRIADVGLLAMDGGPQFLPNKLFEYLAAGLPILSSLPGESAALLRETKCGLTYAPGDAAGFLEALTLLIEDEALLAQMARNALQLYEARFTARAVYTRMAQFLEELAQEELSAVGSWLQAPGSTLHVGDGGSPRTEGPPGSPGSSGSEPGAWSLERGAGA